MVELRCGASRALIATHGAEALSWRVGERDLLWRADPAFWDRVSPVLFPVVGWRRDGQMRVGGKTYPMGVHGFAAQCEFEIAERSDASVRMRLRDSAATRAFYPFAFEFSVTSALTDTALRLTLEVANTGAVALPYACGVHPGFCWPIAGGAREDYRIEFAEREATEVPVIAPGGLFSSERRPVAFDGLTLNVSDELFAREALCFLDARSRNVRFAGPAGAVDCAFEGFRHIALWSRPGAPFLCVEGWTGHGDPVGFVGELAEAPSMLTLAPGEARAHSATFAFSPA